MSYYTTLGVSSSASADDIKRAYRKLAMKYHPDRHPAGAGQARAETQFKSVKEAYETLGDASKRAQYDQHAAWKRTGAGSSGSAYTSRRTASTKHLDVYTQVSLSAKDWYEGCWMTITLPTPYLVVCTACMGRRGVWCAECKSMGKIVRSHVKVHVPARLNYHDLVSVADAGMRDAYGNCGALYIRLRLMDFDHFRLNGSNLHTTVEVPPAVLRFGGKWDVPVTDGRFLRVTIPPRMKARGKLRLAGYGVLRDGRQRGDMLVEVERWQPVTFGQAVGSWTQHVVLGVRHMLAPVVAWWNRPVTS